MAFKPHLALAPKGHPSATQRIKNWVSKFKHNFEAEAKVIDLRAMVDNYPDMRIPLLDIADGIDAVLGPATVERRSVDPSTVKGVPQFAWIPIESAFIDPRFQRDVAPNHIKNIDKNFDIRKITVPCAVKTTVNGKDIYRIWDGGHTAQVLIRRGYKSIPVWFIDENAVDGKNKEEELVIHAGRSFIAINKTFKRPVSGYDEFMILWETKDPDATALMNILISKQCQPYHHKRSPGDVTHFEALWECFKEQTPSGIRGMYLSRALEFHRTHWPKASIEAEIMRPMVFLYAACHAQLGRIPTAEFDKDLGEYLSNRWGSAQSVQEGIKELYAKQYEHGSDSFPFIVKNGLINIYAKYINKEVIAAPELLLDV